MAMKLCKYKTLSEESEDHDRFEIPKCKIMMWPPSINKKMILDLEYAEILKYQNGLSWLKLLLLNMHLNDEQFSVLI